MVKSNAINYDQHWEVVRFSMTQPQLVKALGQIDCQSAKMAEELIGAMMDIEFQALCHRAHILRVQEEEDTC